MPNLNTDRIAGLVRILVALNVRRLMYQPLIWPSLLGDDPRGLRPALDAEDLERLADALVDGVRRDAELDRDFLGGQMLADEPKAVELARRKLRYRPGAATRARDFLRRFRRPLTHSNSYRLRQHSDFPHRTRVVLRDTIAPLK